MRIGSMRAIEDAFTIIHIRISSIKILGISARHFITGLLVVFLFFNTIKVFTSIFYGSVFEFIESAIFIVAIVYFALMWITAWPKAGKMLNRAVGYENEFHHVDKKRRKK